VQQGSELRTIMREVSKLRAALKPRAAQAKLESAETGKAAGKRIIDQRAGELADLLFKCGGLETTRAVLARLMARSDVAQLLSDAVLQSRANATDAKTARAMLEAAKAFFNQLMPGEKRLVPGKWAKSKVHSGTTWVPEHWVAGGRRSLADRNAFWASAAALLPRDIFKSRGGRAAMRILGVHYRVIKQGAKLRGEMEDRGGGWKLLTTAPHRDRVDGALITEW
jgi:hypothetical protein